jgi:hypothetical protein
MNIHLEPTDYEGYRKARLALSDHPIIGQHVIGSIHIEVSHRNWTMIDGPNKWSGATDANVRGRIHKALAECICMKFPSMPKIG